MRSLTAEIKTQHDFSFVSFSHRKDDFSARNIDSENHRVSVYAPNNKYGNAELKADLRNSIYIETENLSRVHENSCKRFREISAVIQLEEWIAIFKRFCDNSARPILQLCTHVSSYSYAFQKIPAAFFFSKLKFKL